jgi:hypothetical protein
MFVSLAVFWASLAINVHAVALVAGLAIEPPYIPVEKPTPIATKTVCPSGCDYSSLDDVDAQPGWLIRVKAGSYNGNMHFDASGKAGKEIVIEAFGDGAAVFKVSGERRFYVGGSHVIFDGGPSRQLIWDGGNIGEHEIMISPKSGSHHLTFSRVKLTGGGEKSGKSGIVIGPNGDYFRLFNSEITDGSSVGVYGGCGIYHEIRNNIVHDNGGSGIQYNPHGTSLCPGSDVATADEVTISGNLIFGNGFDRPAGIRPGITILSNTHTLYDVYIFNNIIWGNKSAGIKHEGTPNVNARIYNNTVFNNENNGFWFKRGGTLDIRNNIVFNNGPDDNANWVPWSGTPFLPDSKYASHNLLTDPKFLSTDPADPNFARVAEGSPAIDAGRADGAPQHDFEDKPRPQGGGYDIGAFEFAADRVQPATPRGLKIR